MTGQLKLIFARVTPEGIRATAKGKPSSPASVERYLKTKFGEHLVDRF